jgi:hypothetical protein
MEGPGRADSVLVVGPERALNSTGTRPAPACRCRRHQRKGADPVSGTTRLFEPEAQFQRFIDLCHLGIR